MSLALGLGRGLDRNSLQVRSSVRVSRKLIVRRGENANWEGFGLSLVL